MKLKIFGPNLTDQSKGQFVVHAADCADCKKLKGEYVWTLTAASRGEVACDVYSDMIKYGPMTEADALGDIHFAPCVKFDDHQFADGLTIREELARTDNP